MVKATAAGAMIAAIDGLGHGSEAADAADTAAATLTAHDTDSPVALMRHCHDSLGRIRGAAITIVTIRTAGGIRWVGVGNIHGRLVMDGAGRSKVLTTRPGIVGSRLPRLRAEQIELKEEGLLVLTSDGVDESAARNLRVAADAQDMADQLLDRHATGDDDALVLVARLDAR